MKKLVSLVLALMMACMLLPAMAEEDVTGDWYLVDYAGVNPADLGLSMTMTLNADGTAAATLEMAGEGETQEGTWEWSGETVVVTLNDQAEEFTIVDGTLQADLGGGAIGTLAREAAEAAAVEFAEVNPEAQAEDFNGNWSATYMSAMGMNLSIESAIALGQMQEVPTLNMQDGTATIAGGELDQLFGDGFELTFADGKYSYSLELGESGISIDLDLLLDGTLRLSVSIGEEEFALYFAKAE